MAYNNVDLMMKSIPTPVHDDVILIQSDDDAGSDDVVLVSDSESGDCPRLPSIHRKPHKKRSRRRRKKLHLPCDLSESTEFQHVSSVSNHFAFSSEVNLYTQSNLVKEVPKHALSHTLFSTHQGHKGKALYEGFRDDCSSLEHELYYPASTTNTSDMLPNNDSASVFDQNVAEKMLNELEFPDKADVAESTDEVVTQDESVSRDEMALLADVDVSLLSNISFCSDLSSDLPSDLTSTLGIDLDNDFISLESGLEMEKAAGSMECSLTGPMGNCLQIASYSTHAMDACSEGNPPPLTYRCESDNPRISARSLSEAEDLCNFTNIDGNSCSIGVQSCAANRLCDMGDAVPVMNRHFLPAGNPYEIGNSHSTANLMEMGVFPELGNSLAMDGLQEFQNLPEMETEEVYLEDKDLEVDLSSTFIKDVLNLNVGEAVSDTLGEPLNFSTIVSAFDSLISAIPHLALSSTLPVTVAQNPLMSSASPVVHNIPLTLESSLSFESQHYVLSSDANSVPHSLLTCVSSLSSAQHHPLSSSVFFPQHTEGSTVPLPHLPHAPLSSDSHAPLLSHSQVTLSSDSHAPLSSDSHVPLSSDSHAPLSSDSHVPLSSDSHAPLSSDSHAPLSSDSLVPLSSDTQAPSSSDSHAPLLSDSQATLSSDSHAPLSSDSHAPLLSDSQVTLSSDSHAPLSDDSHAPLSSDSHVPLSSDSHAPLSSDPHAPLLSHSQVTLSSDSHAPLSSDSHVLLSSDSHAPLLSDSHVPLSSDSHAPLSSDSHVPLSSDSHAPLSSDSLVPLSSDSHAPLSSDSHAPLSSDSSVSFTVPHQLSTPPVYVEHHLLQSAFFSPNLEEHSEKINITQEAADELQLQPISHEQMDDMLMKSDAVGLDDEVGSGDDKTDADSEDLTVDPLDEETSSASLCSSVTSPPQPGSAVSDGPIATDRDTASALLKSPVASENGFHVPPTSIHLVMDSVSIQSVRSPITKAFNDDKNGNDEDQQMVAGETCDSLDVCGDTDAFKTSPVESSFLNNDHGQMSTDLKNCLGFASFSSKPREADGLTFITSNNQDSILRDGGSPLVTDDEITAENEDNLPSSLTCFDNFSTKTQEADELAFKALSNQNSILTGGCRSPVTDAEITAENEDNLPSSLTCFDSFSSKTQEADELAFKALSNQNSILTGGCRSPVTDDEITAENEDYLPSSLICFDNFSSKTREADEPAFKALSNQNSILTGGCRSPVTDDEITAENEDNLPSSLTCFDSFSSKTQEADELAFKALSNQNSILTGGCRSPVTDDEITAENEDNLPSLLTCFDSFSSKTQEADELAFKALSNQNSILTGGCRSPVTDDEITAENEDNLPSSLICFDSFSSKTQEADELAFKALSNQNSILTGGCRSPVTDDEITAENEDYLPSSLMPSLSSVDSINSIDMLDLTAQEDTIGQCFLSQYRLGKRPRSESTGTVDEPVIDVAWKKVRLDEDGTNDQLLQDEVYEKKEELEESCAIISDNIDSVDITENLNEESYGFEEEENHDLNEGFQDVTIESEDLEESNLSLSEEVHDLTDKEEPLKENLDSNEELEDTNLVLDERLKAVQDLDEAVLVHDENVSQDEDGIELEETILDLDKGPQSLSKEKNISEVENLNSNVELENISREIEGLNGDDVGMKEASENISKDGCSLKSRNVNDQLLSRNIHGYEHLKKSRGLKIKNCSIDKENLVIRSENKSHLDYNYNRMNGRCHRLKAPSPHPLALGCVSDSDRRSALDVIVNRETGDVVKAKCFNCLMESAKSVLAYCTAGHGCCSGCLHGQVKAFLATSSKSPFSCQFQGCNSFYLISQLRSSLPKIVVDILEAKLEREYSDSTAQLLKKVNGIREMNIDTDEEQDDMEPVYHHGTSVPSEICAAKDTFELPLRWKETNENEYQLIDITANSSEFAEVSELFHRTMLKSRATILRLQRLQNPVLWEFYTVKKKQKEMEGVDKRSFERLLFHGIRREFVDTICLNNFDWRTCGVSHGIMYGQGTYFARDASYAHRYTDRSPNITNKSCSSRLDITTTSDDMTPPVLQIDDSDIPLVSPADTLPFDPKAQVASQSSSEFPTPKSVAPDDWERHAHLMFLARVIVGRYTRGKRTYRKPPAVDLFMPYGKCYDSCVNYVDDPTLFVIFDSSQYYPEYLIHYTNRPKAPS